MNEFLQKRAVDSKVMQAELRNIINFFEKEKEDSEEYTFSSKAIAQIKKINV